MLLLATYNNLLYSVIGAFGFYYQSMLPLLYNFLSIKTSLNSFCFMQRCISPPTVSLQDIEATDVETKSPSESSECKTLEGGAVASQLEHGNSQTLSCNNSETINSATKTHTFLAPQETHLSEHYPEDENAKTAAAVAAAACIGEWLQVPAMLVSGPKGTSQCVDKKFVSY